MFEFNIEHAKSLKLIGRVSRPFESHKTRWIIFAVVHGRYLISTNKKFGNPKSKPQKHKEKPQNIKKHQENFNTQNKVYIIPQPTPPTSNTQL